MATLVALLTDVLGLSGTDWASIGLAWARAMPAVILVPAFGLRALPRPAQALIGLGLAICIAPAIAPSHAVGAARWLAAALAEVVKGLPVALAAAIPLWAATMAGGVADTI